MANVYKREGSDFYTYEFYFQNKRVRKCTDQSDKDVAWDMMAAHRTRLARGESGILERKRISLADFLKREFVPFIQSKCAAKPATLRYYRYGVSELQASDFASLDLSEITDQHAGQFAAKRANLSPSTVNCGLRTLRRALYLAFEWGKLDRMPQVTLARGERQRERVLSDSEVEAYLAACAQPWRDAATIMLGTGMRPSEVFSLRWESVHLNGKGGLLQVAQGKSRAAKRMLPMVPRVYSVLKARRTAEEQPENGWVFSAKTKSGHLEGYCAKNQHSAALKTIRKAAEEAGCETPIQAFPPYTLRHTALTRLAEAGCDAHTLARIAGHSSILITQRYVHPGTDAVERAFAALPEALATPSATS
jgi:integrase